MAGTGVSGTALLLYFGFVAVAVGGLALALNRLGKGEQAAFSIDEARALLTSHFPDARPGEARTTRHAVLFALEGGGIGLVRAQGAHPLTRIVTAAEVRAVTSKPGRVTLKLRDYADPRIVLHPEEPEDLREWLRTLLV
jgi:hypothetical protein